MDSCRNSEGSDGQQQLSRGQRVLNSDTELSLYSSSLAEEVL